MRSIFVHLYFVTWPVLLHVNVILHLSTEFNRSIRVRLNNEKSRESVYGMSRIIRIVYVVLYNLFKKLQIVSFIIIKIFINWDLRRESCLDSEN